MRIPRATLLVVAVALMAITGLGVPMAADAAVTTVTFNIAAGALTVNAPASVTLSGSGVPGSNLTGQLGVVTVTDARAALIASWTATAATTTFVTGGATAAETIGKAAISYASGAATNTSGVGVFTPGQATPALAAAMTTAQTAFTLTTGTGSNSAAWNPTLVIAVPAAAVAGTYTGTITQSAA